MAGTALIGTAQAVDGSGRLLVRSDGVLHRLAGGDVTHPRKPRGRDPVTGK